MSTQTTAFVPGDVVGRRAQAPHTSMFLRMLVRAAVLRKGRAASALLAMVVAAAAATAMINLFVDVQAKLRNEFRNYGANIVVVGKDGEALPVGAIQQVESAMDGHGMAVPFAYVVARTTDGQSVVVVGTEFDRVKALDHWWKVSAWPATSQQALVGIKTLPVVAPRNTATQAESGQASAFSLTFQGREIQLQPAGTLQTGAAEDSRIFIPMADFTAWTGVQPSTIEIAATGSADDVNATMRRLAQTLPSSEVRPVRQIMEGEARVLNKTRATLLASAVLIILTAALCVLATLIGWVMDRRRDFAIMKALGASERLLNGFFAAESAVLGLVGGILGFAIGVGVAMWIGRVNFNAPVVPRFSVLPWVLLGSMAVALLSAVVPVGLLRRVQPATILRGE
jgi:putative ABC transport system permease protein